MRRSFVDRLFFVMAGRDNGPPRLPHSALAPLISNGSLDFVRQAEEAKKDEIALVLFGIRAAAINLQLSEEDRAAMKNQLFQGTMPDDVFAKYLLKGQRFANVLTVVKPSQKELRARQWNCIGSDP